MIEFKNFTFLWSEEKNKKLIRERNVSFEKIVESIRSKDENILEVIDNKTHRGEQMLVIKIDELIYVVPFMKIEDTVVLKTIFKNREATKKYGGNSDEKI